VTNPLRPSPLVSHLRRHESLTAGSTELVLAGTTGMCRGVKRALGMVAKAREGLSDGRRVLLLHEIIHNPTVGRWLRAGGIETLDTEADEWWAALSAADTVIIPAFGATVNDERLLRAAGVKVIDTTCPSVRGVWSRVSAYAQAGFTTVLHGRPDHPETRATLSRAIAAGGHYLVVREAADAREVAEVIGGAENGGVVRLGEGVLSPGFESARDLTRIGLVNQTTMLADESREIAAVLGDALIRRYGDRELESRFRTFGTICRATQERQDAIRRLTNRALDLLFVVGGHASSNTRHLAELGGRSVRTYHVEGPQALQSLTALRHQSLGTRTAAIDDIAWLADLPHRVVGFAGGASTPDAEVGETMVRLLLLLGEPCPPVAEAERILAAHG
jgi:4-hydroxy-3-methylbut-2-enyl diphosphate reductase